MKYIIVILCLLLISCTNESDDKTDEREYWYYYKSITQQPNDGTIHTGTIISTKIYHIGDQTHAKEHPLVVEEFKKRVQIEKI